MKVLRTTYKVTIEKIEIVESIGRSYELISETGNEENDGKVWGYVEYPTTKDVSTDMLTQETETIDIPAVIKAINNL